MALQRRQFLLLLGAGVGGVALSTTTGCSQQQTQLPFAPVRTPLPLPSDGLTPSQQREAYRVVRINDALSLPEGYDQQLLASWGDPVGSSRFGFNNDFLAFRQLDANSALLTVNFEYISPLPWSQGFAEVTGSTLPYEQVVQALAGSNGKRDVWADAPAADVTAAINSVAAEALADQGIGVIRLKRDGQGRWQRQPGPEDRRITGLAGLDDPERRLRATGPASAVFRLAQRQGYDDGLGDRIIGTFANCAGGTTPWGTVLSAEENFQSQVPEDVYADGSAMAPSARPFTCQAKRL